MLDKLRRDADRGEAPEWSVGVGSAVGCAISTPPVSATSHPPICSKVFQLPERRGWFMGQPRAARLRVRKTGSIRRVDWRNN